MIIDPDGLFHGDRLRMCSNSAQLHWPRLFLASDGFARLEINYARIIGRAYTTFNPVPSETELEGLIREYAGNHLLFLFEAGGALWGQWDTQPKFLPRYKTAGDRRSPIPPEPAYSEWRKSYLAEKKSFPKSFGKFPETFLYGVGVGEGKYISASFDADALPVQTPSPNGLAQTPPETPIDHSGFPPVDNAPFDPAGGDGAAEAWHLSPEDRKPSGKPAKRISKAAKSEVEQWFEQVFWPDYPRKVDKADALKWCLKHAAANDTREQIMEGLRRDLPAMLAAEDRQFIAYPATYLRKRRWEPQSGAGKSADDLSQRRPKLLM
ncbi:MAG: hypothetical protein IT166_18890 [Bryobacterales bacterium]|nr:hypothetical protein [Bryobacterales bacterium]